ncbi:MAG: hypothetical protein HQ541_03335 [Mariniphaga sp.]|nr:hypothetical protein [Mariniphaga sp.]
METDKIKALWKKGEQLINEENIKSKKEMETIITTKTLKTGKKILSVFKTAAAVQIFGLGLHFFNLYKYRQETDVFNLVVFSLVVLILSLLYTLRMHSDFTKSSMEVQNLKDALLSRIAFYKQKYNMWLIVYSFSYVLLIIGASMIVDDYQIPSITGDYPLFILNLIAFVLVYFSYRSLNVQFLREYKTYLYDIENKTLTDLKEQEKKYKRLVMILLVIGVIIMAIGLALFFIIAK